MDRAQDGGEQSLLAVRVPPLRVPDDHRVTRGQRTVEDRDRALGERAQGTADDVAWLAPKDADCAITRERDDTARVRLEEEVGRAAVQRLQALPHLGAQPPPAMACGVRGDETKYGHRIDRRVDPPGRVQVHRRAEWSDRQQQPPGVLQHHEPARRADGDHPDFYGDRGIIGWRSRAPQCPLFLRGEARTMRGCASHLLPPVHPGMPRGRRSGCARLS